MAAEIKLALPDGSTVKAPAGSTAAEVAGRIGKRLAADAVAARVDGELVDLARPIDGDGSLEIITADGSAEALEILRHSTSHLLAHAVKQLWPDVQVAIGPAIENGFYYDFLKSEPFTDEDLERIEQRMRELAEQDIEIRHVFKPKAEAIEQFRALGEDLKVELVRERVEGDTASLYEQGDFVDLCRGPHLPSTGRIKAFKLLSIAGAYWKGDENNVQLQRIYGTSFFSEKELKAHLEWLAEAKRRDHRKLGRELDLFSFSDEAGGGLVFWHPKGAFVRNKVEAYLTEKLTARGYQMVITPHVARGKLWELSGHMSYYSENMFLLDDDGEPYVVKPMNCPGHIVIYKSRLRSYRELPVRIAEFGTVYRRERAGVRHGLMRVRGFTVDDAHIFCTREQMDEEVEELLRFCFEVYDDFGFEKRDVMLSVRDPLKPEKYAGSDEGWELAENSLRAALERNNIEYTREEGEAVFYGPKIDIKLHDSLGRSWQLTTIQFDFNLPSRLDVQYIGEDGAEHQVFMVHRALLGSVERFMGVLIEHYGGAFPLWLAPVQAVVLPITDAQLGYARQVAERLRSDGLRVEVDERSEKIGYKIREHQMQKVPYMLVCGPREAQSGNVSVRNRFEGDLGASETGEFTKRVSDLVGSKAVRP